jgi:hypothetical protein
VVDEAFMDNTPQQSLAPFPSGRPDRAAFVRQVLSAWPGCGWALSWPSASYSSCSPNRSGHGRSAVRREWWARCLRDTGAARQRARARGQ